MDATSTSPLEPPTAPDVATLEPGNREVPQSSNRDSRAIVSLGKKLQPWAQFAELLSSVAVIVTLFFLIVEVRNNTRALERQIELDGISRVTGPLISSSDFAEIYGKVKEVDGAEPLTVALSKRYRLTLDQSVRWARYHHQIWLGLQADYLHNGRSDRLDATIRSLLPFPDSKQFWQHEKGLFTKSFVSYVEGLH